MKKINQILFLYLLFSNVAFSQKIAYSYSPSGNRIQRKFEMSAFRVGTKDSSSVKEFPKILMSEGISVYPNPTKDVINVSINDYNASQKNNLTLIDAKGNEILSQTISSQKTEFNLSHIKAGVYYFKVVKNETILHYKIVKIE